MYADSILSLVVPLVVIGLVILTRQVVLSLFVGIVVAGLMLSDGLVAALGYIFHTVLAVFYDKEAGQIELGSFYVFGFLILLGILTQMMQASGGIYAFVSWARKRIKSPRGSEFVAFIAGIVIFIDDYFNALSVGQIARPLNDANHSTRERLAYIIDSTSAPICILMPISSWGAYLLGLLDNDHAFEQLLASVWGNYYAWFALLGVFLTILWQINLPAMQANQNVQIQIQEDNDQPQTQGSVWHLVLPIVSLIFFVGFLIFYSGYKAKVAELAEANASTHSLTIFEMLANADTGFSLFWGGLLALGVSLALSLTKLNISRFFVICQKGFMTMLPANLILILAWSLGPVIKNDLQTGLYLAHMSRDLMASVQGFSELFIPLIIFVISGFIAFCTGTSWGTFAIMLPIGASMAEINGIDAALIMSAVLAGAVYGDHASPISDTTILSSIGAGCLVQSHFITQLPYATSIALMALVSFGVAGISHSLLLGHVVGVVGMIIIFGAYKKLYASNLANVKI